MKTSVHNADMATSKSDSSAIKTALTSAHEIASLVQVYRTEFGLEYAHQFAMYAINVSLFCLLAQKAFDISDPDFSSLASAFSAIACRSQVGRHLFHAFKLSVRSRNKAGQMQSSEDTPLEIQELFGPREDLGEPDKWDRYAEGLADVDGEGSFLRELGMVPAVPGLHDMLRWYERLSVGQEIQWRGNGRDAEF